jgi:flagellar hook-associated protein 3 FlgL
MSPGINPDGQRFIDAVSKIQTRLNDAQRQISSGKKVNQPSDGPDELSPILQLHAEIHQNTAIQNGLSAAQTTVNAAEQALSSSVNLLQNASVIASQATGLSQTAETRASLAQNVDGLLRQLLANSQTTVDGNFIFSADQSQTQLYQLNLASPGGVDRLAIATNTNVVQGPGGIQIPATQTANTIFDHRNPDDSVASDNAFGALNDLRVALLNNDSVGINASISALQTTSSYMNDQLAFYGTAQTRLDSAVNDSKSNSVQLQTELSGREDADAVSAITELTQAQTQLQAVLSARARVPQTTLFDVLPAA